MAVPSKNCQKPSALDGDTTFANPLSATARYFRSSGIPSSFNMGSIIGKYRCAFLIKIKVCDC